MKTNPVCPSCGYENTEEYRYCPKCRFPLMLIANKYRIERQIDEGGMGMVYLVHHAGLDYDTERVAKVIKPEVFATHNIDKRFHREVQITAALSQQNEHIVRIYDDFGEEEGLGHYYVMEYLQGMPLGDIIVPEQGISLPIALHIFYQTSKALVQAHEQNVVHRDLKPDNIFLIKRGSDEHFVKLLDFGIAKPEKADTKLTHGVVGTPLYMSPEQCASAAIDNRSDIYSMGLILYELLSGRLPYGIDIDNDSPLTILAAHLKKKPLALHRFVPELSWLSPIIQKSLSKKPSQRYATMREFWEAIEAAAPSTLSLPSFETTSISVSSHDLVAVGPGDELSMTSRLTPTPASTTQRSWWLIAILALVCVGGLGWALTRFGSKPSQPSIRDAGVAVRNTRPRPVRVPVRRPVAIPDKERPRPVVPRTVEPRPVAPRPVRLRPPSRSKRVRRRSRKRIAKRIRPRRRVVKSVVKRHKCGANKAQMRWVFARLRRPSSGRPTIAFPRCKSCTWKRMAGGICLQVPKRKVSAKILLTGYQTCLFPVYAKTRDIRWRLKIEDANELAFEDYPCTK